MSNDALGAYRRSVKRVISQIISSLSKRYSPLLSPLSTELESKIGVRMKNARVPRRITLESVWERERYTAKHKSDEIFIVNECRSYI